MSVIEKTGILIKKHPTYEVGVHPMSDRLLTISLNDEVLQEFFLLTKEMTSQDLEYVPYMRKVVADWLDQVVQYNFKHTLREIIHDRSTGGFTIGVQGKTNDPEKYVIFATAISHLIGDPNFDAMTGKYYARFTVKDTDNSDSYLRQAYRLFTLHTDGTFVDEPTDWLMMMKFKEEHAVGGESRLLHLDDWKELDKYRNHPIASYKFTYKAPPSKNVVQAVERETFFEINNRPCICFIDQFVYPETIEQANYLREMSQSMENDPSLIELPLPTGDLVVINNTFWLHGRAAFKKHTALNRELMRQRGTFAKQ